jgi:hypothetical protein
MKKRTFGAQLTHRNQDCSETPPLFDDKYFLKEGEDNGDIHDLPELRKQS